MKRYSEKITNIIVNLLFKKLYSFFKIIFIKNNIPIKTTLKSLKKGPDNKDKGNNAIKYDGKFISILSCKIDILF